MAEVSIDTPRLHQALDQLVLRVGEIAAQSELPCHLVGVANGAVPLVQFLQRRLRRGDEYGSINVSFHRDDIGLKPIPRNFVPTDLPFPVDDAHIVLIDDVIASGRTIRAALNELFDYGRPARVTLAVLIDTDRRMLPIQPDYAAIVIPGLNTARVKLVFDPTHPEEATVHIS